MIVYHQYKEVFITLPCINVDKSLLCHMQVCRVDTSVVKRSIMLIDRWELGSTDFCQFLFIGCINSILILEPNKFFIFEQRLILQSPIEHVCYRDMGPDGNFVYYYFLGSLFSNLGEYLKHFLCQGIVLCKGLIKIL
jgi:hypothetical protein